jgi:transcriptional regulator with XRE-family HTH domain
MNNVEVTIKIQTTLKQLLTEQNLSLRELAKRSGVPNSTLQEWSSNRSPKNPIQVQKVAQVLGVSMHYLIFGEEDKSEPLTKLLKEDVFSGTYEINIKRVRAK